MYEGTFRALCRRKRVPLLEVMNMHQFNYQSIEQRAALVWKHGRFPAIRYSQGCSVVLYHLDAFFAEVWYSPEYNQMKTVRGFKSKVCWSLT